MTAIWNATGVTPAATNRLPVDVSSSGGASRVTMQQLADLGVLVGESHNALGTISSGTNDIDLSLGGFVSATIGGALTFTFSNPPASPNGCEWVLVLTNGGSAVVTWPGSVTWVGGTAPTLQASGIDVLRFYTVDGGTSWIGELAFDESGFLSPSDIASGTITPRADDIDLSGGTDGDVLTVQADGSLALETPAGGGSSNTRWVGAGELIPRVTSGAGIDGEELSTNKVNLDYLAFDTAADEYAQVAFAWPSGFSTFTATFHWTAASGSGGVVWRSSARCYADDDALDQAMGTAQSVADTLLAANDAHKSSATSAITPAGTVAAGNLCVVQVSRNTSDGSDTLAVDARLIGVLLEFSV